MQYLIIYLLAINLIGFAIMGIDKSKSKKHQWRISEATLLLVAFFGGALGVKWGMEHFHHKTKHAKFVIGVPLAIIVNIAAIGYIYYRFFM